MGRLGQGNRLYKCLFRVFKKKDPARRKYAEQCSRFSGIVEVMLKTFLFMVFWDAWWSFCKILERDVMTVSQIIFLADHDFVLVRIWWCCKVFTLEVAIGFFCDVNRLFLKFLCPSKLTNDLLNQGMGGRPLHFSCVPL